MSVVVSYLKGGLGNQLFQYAAAFALAKRCGGQVHCYHAYVDTHNDAYCLDKMIKNYQPAKHVIAYNKWQCSLSKRGLTRRWHMARSMGYEPVFEALSLPVQLYGYFFSYHYFQAVESDLRQQFVWPIRASIIKKTKEMMQNHLSVGIHVRRGDYLIPEVQKSCGVQPLSLDYYRRAVSLLMAALGKDVHFYLFTNDVPYVEQHFDFCAKRTILDPTTHAPYEALYLMKQCDHFILANSTLSWWGAWLNPSTDRYVIAPRVWFDHCSNEFLAGFLPMHWVLM